MEEDVVIVYCTDQDFQFLADSFETFAQSLLEEFELPIDADVMIEVDPEVAEGSVDVFFNGEPLGTILIMEEAPKLKEKRVLH